MPFVYVTPFFFFNDTATTEIYTLSLHDALPIYPAAAAPGADHVARAGHPGIRGRADSGAGAVTGGAVDRKSTRLNSSHANISYAVFCLKKNKKPTLSASGRPRYGPTSSHTSYRS